jgi:hypothetical protein
MRFFKLRQWSSHERLSPEGWLAYAPGREPKNPASPNVKMPPSNATNQ